MKVSDILRIKGSTLYTANPDESLIKALGVSEDTRQADLAVRA